MGLTSRAFVSDPPLAKSVTSWPRSTSPSATSATTRSIPPYPGGGTGYQGGAICAIRIWPTYPRPHSSEPSRTSGSFHARGAAVELGGERVAQRRCRPRDPRRGSRVRDLSRIRRHRGRIPSRPLLSRHPFPLGALSARQRELATAAG